MKIYFDNVYAHVRERTDAEWDWLREYLVVPNPLAHIVEGQEKTISLYNGFSNRFPAGLVSRVRSSARAAGFKVKTYDERPEPVPADLDGPNDFDWPYDYQREAAVAAITKRRGIIKLPFGGGKGDLAVLIAWSVNQDWIFLTHRTQLVLDIADRWQKRTELQAGLIVRGKWQLPDPATKDQPSLLCATFSALHAKAKKYPNRVKNLLRSKRGLLVDECHVAAASTHAHLLYRTPRCDYRIGLSGTPLDRLDKRNTITAGIFGRVIYKKSTEELVAAKVISKCTVRLVRCIQFSEAKTLVGVRGELIVRSKVRNKLIMDIVKRSCDEGKLTLVFVAILKHGWALEKALINAGIQARFVWGNHSTEYREAAARDLVAGRLSVVVSNQVWHEGINIHALRTIVNAAGGKSTIWTLQRAGRGARIVRDEKYEFDLWDIDDQGQRWLEDHAARRKRAYKRAGYEIIEEEVSTT